MGSLLGAASGMVLVVVLVFLLILSVLWMILPFAVFRLRKEMIGLRADLKAMHDRLDWATSKTVSATETIAKHAGITNEILAAVHNVELPQ